MTNRLRDIGHRISRVQQQIENTKTCGYFAILYAFMLGNNENPEKGNINMKKLKDCVADMLRTKNTQHLRNSYKKNRKISTDIPMRIKIKLFCICRTTNDFERMIACDKCKCWFHVECLSDVTQNQIDILEESYYCPICQSMQNCSSPRQSEAIN